MKGESKNFNLSHLIPIPLLNLIYLASKNIPSRMHTLDLTLSTYKQILLLFYRMLLCTIFYYPRASVEEASME